MVAPDYQPWFQPLYEPASGEIESLLFTLQGSLGAAVILHSRICEGQTAP
nr:Energy-coupling factor transporter probable substrate-capture protein CbiN [Klebsiella pneumoniae]